MLTGIRSRHWTTFGAPRLGTGKAAWLDMSSPGAVYVWKSFLEYGDLTGQIRWENT
jgi:hypothetical protein